MQFLGRENIYVNSVDNENEVKIRWHMTGWYVPSMTNVWNKNGVPSWYRNEVTDIISKNLM
jgi:hypothetical protein